MPSIQGPGSPPLDDPASAPGAGDCRRHGAPPRSAAAPGAHECGPALRPRVAHALRPRQPVTPSEHGPLAVQATQALTRSARNRERIARLRRELRKSSPASCPQTARDEIVKALARAGLADWTVPALDDAQATRCADGSLRIALVAHQILLNPSGAYRIVDLHAPRAPWFEKNGRDGRAFVMPGQR